MKTPKDLTQQPPASPRERVGGYAILARCADKGRADLAGTSGAYHFNCPVDNYLFDFKGVKADDIRELLENDASNEEVAAWLDDHGIPRSEEEKAAWSNSVEQLSFYGHPDKHEWFVTGCTEVGIDPAHSSLFDYLDADDKMTFESAAQSAGGGS